MLHYGVSNYMGTNLGTKKKKKKKLHRIHSDGHLCLNKCRRQAQDSVWWLNLSIQLNTLAHNCSFCNNVFNLDLNVAIKSNSFNEAGNLFRKWGAIYENTLSEKYCSDVALCTSSQIGSSEVLKPMSTWTFWKFKRSARYLGAPWFRAFKVKRQILNSILALTGSQCSSIRNEVEGTQERRE